MTLRRKQHSAKEDDELLLVSRRFASSDDFCAFRQKLEQTLGTLTHVFLLNDFPEPQGHYYELIVLPNARYIKFLVQSNGQIAPDELQTCNLKSFKQLKQLRQHFSKRNNRMLDSVLRYLREAGQGVGEG